MDIRPLGQKKIDLWEMFEYYERGGCRKDSELTFYNFLMENRCIVPRESEMELFDNTKIYPNIKEITLQYPFNDLIWLSIPTNYFSEREMKLLNISTKSIEDEMAIIKIDEILKFYLHTPKMADKEVYILKLNNNWTAGFYVPDWHFLFISLWEATDTYLLCQEIQTIICKDKKKLKQSKVSITLGGDPEFELYQDGCFTCADNLGEYGDIDISLDSNIGYDGSGTQLELRPMFGSTPKEYINNVGKTILDFHNIFGNNDFTFSAKGDYAPLGGHIHVGLRRDGKTLSPDPELAQLLDMFIGKKLLSLSGEARRSYKKLTQIRANEHGFEYRTPPSCYYVDPEICKIIYKLTYNIVDWYYNKKRKISFNKLNSTAYKKFGLSNKEYQKLQQFIKMWKTNRDTLDNYYVIINKWRKYIGGEHPIIRIEFSNDYWNDLREDLSRLSFKKPKMNYVVRFFGYREDRGKVSNISLPECSIVEQRVIENTSYTININIGLPYALRVPEKIDENYIKWKDDCLKAITEYVNKTITEMEKCIIK